MKNLLFIIFFISTIGIKAQFLNGKPLSELDADYIQVIATVKLLKPMQANITVDYGQMSKIKDIKKSQVFIDETQKKRYAFNGIMGMLNTFSSYGYELVNAYPVTHGGGGQVYHYYLRKQN